MNNILLKIKRWMAKRNGFDDLAMVAYVLSLLFYLIGRAAGIEIMGLLGTLLFFYCLFRVFSSNVYKRKEENRKFSEFRWKLISRINRKKAMLKGSKQYKYFKCPDCRQTLRIPRGRGKVDVTCPKCGKVFEKRS